MIPVHASLLRPPQFRIAQHYDVMADLDRDVHDDRALAETEVDTAIRLIDSVPRRVFLPCFGTGRHIAPLLARGVQYIVGVDLSPRCVEKARESFGNDTRVELHVGDLTSWRTTERFDASILLGNSFGDIVDLDLLRRVTRGMVAPLTTDGTFLMDYIGEGYLDRCRAGTLVRWEAELKGKSVYDDRTPRFDPIMHVMSIDVRATDRSTGGKVWTGTYQKTILNDGSVKQHFREVGFNLSPIGPATQINPYYTHHTGELGMLACSTWWMGRRILA